MLVTLAVITGQIHDFPVLTTPEIISDVINHIWCTPGTSFNPFKDPLPHSYVFRSVGM